MYPTGFCNADVFVYGGKDGSRRKPRMLSYSTGGRSPGWGCQTHLESMPTAPSVSGPGLENFFSPPYQAHNRARLDHLASLGLPLSKRRVLELGSGPGDHTGFYVRRECSIVSVDSRQDCLDVLHQRYPNVQTVLCDLNSPAPLADLGIFDVIHCYGVRLSPRNSRPTHPVHGRRM